MNEPASSEADAGKTPSRRGGKTKWVLFLGLALYLLLTAPNSLLGLIMGVGGDGWGGTLELKERIALLILGANLPLTLAALVTFGAGLRRPPIRRRAVLLLLGLGVACVVCSMVADVVFGVDIY